MNANFANRRVRLGVSAVLVASAIAAVSYAGMSSVASLRPSSIAAKSSLRQPAQGKVRALMLLGQLGMSPESLAAAGLNAQQARTVALTAADFAVTRGDELAALDSGEAAAIAEIEQATRDAAAGNRGADASAARARLASLRQQRDRLLTAARNACGLSNDQSTIVNTIQKNRHRGLPVEYLTVNRTEQEWTSLSARLAAAASNAATGSRNTDAAVVDAGSDAQAALLRRRLADSQAISDAIMSVLRTP